MEDDLSDIGEWATIVAAYHKALVAAMPHVSIDFINQLVLDWQRLMIERVRNAPDIVRMDLAPGPQTAYTMNRLLSRSLSFSHP